MTKAGGKSKKTDVTELENPIIVAIPPISEAESNEADVRDDKKSKSKKRKNKEEATAEIPEETDPAVPTDDSEIPKPTKKATKKPAVESEPIEEPIIVSTPQVINGEVKKRGRKKKVVEVESAEGADAVLESDPAPVPNDDAEIVKPVNAKTKKANSKAYTAPASSTQITDHVLFSEPTIEEIPATASGELIETILDEPVATVRKIVRRLQDWNIHYAAILEYFKEFGTCDVPKNRSYECDLPGKYISTRCVMCSFCLVGP